MDIRQTVLDNLSYGLYIVTSHLDGRLNGQISDALMQVAAVPPRVAVSINKNELTHEFISKSGVFGVSILSRSADLRFVGLFGFRSGRDTDKLAQATHRIGETGCPLVTQNSVAVFEAEVRRSVDVGTHTIFVGDVLKGEIIGDADILTYHYYTNVIKGKVSRNSERRDIPRDVVRRPSPRLGLPDLRRRQEQLLIEGEGRDISAWARARRRHTACRHQPKRPPRTRQRGRVSRRPARCMRASKVMGNSLQAGLIMSIQTSRSLSKCAAVCSRHLLTRGGTGG